MKPTCDDVVKIDEVSIRKTVVNTLADILLNMGYPVDVHDDRIHVYTRDFKKLAERIAEALRPLNISTLVVEEGKKIDVRIHCGGNMAVICIYNLGRNEREISVWKVL